MIPAVCRVRSIGEEYMTTPGFNSDFRYSAVSSTSLTPFGLKKSPGLRPGKILLVVGVEP